MAPSLYAPLSTDTFSIRLIKLQPSDDTSAPILCSLVTYPIISDRCGAHSYECLSYVWGTPVNPRTINIDTGEAVIPFQATPNLYEALLHLRDPFFEQILWIDALCINQKDDEEKTTQVAAMGRIYGLAKRVVVWLGAEADDSTLAFERLRDLAQTQQSSGSSQSGEIMMRAKDDDVNDRDSCNPGAEQAIKALLNRPYFRRMWILQEVTAARNMLFRCGTAEMQTTTFLAGLDALELLDDWELRNRILAFLLLIKTSAFRESLKGRAHLDIEPLNDLIDRFHTHDATDPRDKIYALWGLCSDSSLMKNLQPNYKKEWKDLLEELGKLNFGKESIVSASSLRQMMFVRTTGYVLGQVEEIAVAGGVWESFLRLKITALRASTLLNPTCAWTVWTKMRAPAERILEGDYVLLLPHVSRIVFARPIKYYLRVIMVIDSTLVEADYFGTDSSYDLWQPRLHWRFSGNHTSCLSLLWSWERHYEQEEDDSLILMSNSDVDLAYAATSTCAQALCRARALSDMAALYVDYKEYDVASTLLASMVKIYINVCGKESESAVTGRKRMNDALGRKATYDRAMGLMLELQEPYSPQSLFQENCAKAILEDFMMGDELKSDLDMTINVLVELASKEMSTGVSKELLMQALDRIGVFDTFAVNRTSNEYTKQKLPSDLPKQQNYVRFLLELAEDDIYISGSELLAAAKTKLSESNLIRLAKRSDNPLQNLPRLLEIMKSKRWNGLDVQHLVYELGDRIVVTSDAINVAAMWDPDALSALLLAAKGAPVVVPTAFTIAMQNLNESTPAMIDLLAQHAAPGCVVPEETIEMIACGDASNRALLQWVFISLLENTKLVVNVPKKIVITASSTTMKEKNNVIELLRFRPDVPITYDIDTGVKKASSMAEPAQDRVLSLYNNFPAYANPIGQEDIDALSAADIAGYASFINLVRYRKDDFKITEDLILRALHQKKKEARRSSWLYGDDTAPWDSLLVIDRCTAFLVRHADSDVITALVPTSALAETATSRGLPHVICALQSRPERFFLQFESLHVVAELCLLLQRPLEPGESFVHMQKIRSLIGSLAEMDHKLVSDNVKRATFLHAKRGQYSDVAVDMLLDNGFLDAAAVGFWEEQFLDTEAGHQESGVQTSFQT